MLSLTQVQNFNEKSKEWLILIAPVGRGALEELVKTCEAALAVVEATKAYVDNNCYTTYLKAKESLKPFIQ